MSLHLRLVTPDDAEIVGTICFDAFTSIANQHNFPPDFPGVEIAHGFVQYMLELPECRGFVVESGGRIVGSNFLWEFDPIAGIGPITVDPGAQNARVGRMLMQAVLDRVAELGRPGVRLVQAAYHNRSLSLYTKLGFNVREPLATLQGPPIAFSLPGHHPRPATEADLPGCNRLCFDVHGHDRSAELTDAIRLGQAALVERQGRVTAYTTGIGLMGHAVAESNDDMRVLIAAAPAFLGPGFLLPMRNGELFRWCLANGLRVVHTMNLMSIGLYNEPRGAFLPSVLY